MEFITGEQFLKESKEVQEVINNSIKLNIGDRIYHKLSKKYYIYLGEYNEIFWNVFDLEYKCTRVVCKDYFCRCLHEGRLREFIENKANYKISCDIGEYGYQITLYKFNEGNRGEEHKIDYYRHFSPMDLKTCNLLQAYWKVAVKVAKESIKH